MIMYNGSRKITRHGDLMVPDVKVNIVKVVEEYQLPRLVASLHSLHNSFS